MAYQLSDLQALVQRSREEQAIITEKLAALQSTVDQPLKPLSVSALRTSLADLDSALLERDAQIDDLRARIASMQATLKEGAAAPGRSPPPMWQHLYEESQIRLHAREEEADRLASEKKSRAREIATLSTYRKKVQATLEEDFDRSRRRLEQPAIKRIVYVRSTKRKLEEQAQTLRDSVLQCLSRCAGALACGILTVLMRDRSSTEYVVFAVLRRLTTNTCVLELFEEPEAENEFLALEVSEAQSKNEPGNLEITMLGVGGESVTALFTSNEECLKWVGALYIGGLLDKSDYSVLWARTKES
eukprot:CAMPEP_0117480646 /NCGR_PEP_ID=MMETSP0784-20121206/12496_1 /TAXON_ID=39447 /ORGANISM="" /LENGTH=301 /DNA_ID=CAMNT_0005275087 /DNA_START=63 /DNA_END=968 /DNA_ORIENTATION=+